MSLLRSHHIDVQKKCPCCNDSAETSLHILAISSVVQDIWDKTPLYFNSAYGADSVCTGPFDVVKMQLMTEGRFTSEVKYKGTFHAISTIYVEEGLFALWKGLLLL
ncbi:hypothetical protein LguiA_028466 [Lonicera macranthoides]